MGGQEVETEEPVTSKQILPIYRKIKSKDPNEITVKGISLYLYSFVQSSKLPPASDGKKYGMGRGGRGRGRGEGEALVHSALNGISSSNPPVRTQGTSGKSI